MLVRDCWEIHYLSREMYSRWHIIMIVYGVELERLGQGGRGFSVAFKDTL